VKAASIDGDVSNPESCKAVIEEIDNPYYGIAYESDIAIASGVSTDYLIAMGVEEVLNYAWNRQEQLGKPYPVVINISMGNNSGPHDGSSYLSKYLDEISEEDYTNNVVCIAAGNEGDLAISLHNIFSEDNNTVKTGLKSFNTDPVEFPNILYGPVYVYSDSDEPFEIQATVYNKERGSVIFRGVAGIPTGEELGSSRYYATSSQFQGSSSDIVSEQLGRYFNGYIGIIGFWDEDSGRYMGVIDPLLWENEENGGNYVVVVEVKGAANHQVDFYTDGNFFEFDDLGLADQGLLKGTTDGTIADTATGKNVVVVGSYNTRDQWASLDGEIYSYDLFNKSEVSLFSSWGTLLDGRELPHVCAPGATVISSTNEYYLEDNGVGIDNLQATVDADGRRYSWHQCVGTSMSTPVVAGAIALWKEADPTLRYDDIQDIIAKTAVK
ncbi:MAG: S8 family serine peptidase, partial [Muribaculaceae bacterium]|nr:S8 family serine peptidase [Muribaculaceae bacterium]